MGERGRTRERESERERLGSYIGAFEISRLLGIKSARPFTGSSGCVAVSRLYPLLPAASLFSQQPPYHAPSRTPLLFDGNAACSTIGAREFSTKREIPRHEKSEKRVSSRQAAVALIYRVVAGLIPLGRLVVSRVFHQSFADCFFIKIALLLAIFATRLWFMIWFGQSEKTIFRSQRLPEIKRSSYFND